MLVTLAAAARQAVGRSGGAEHGQGRGEPGAGSQRWAPADLLPTWEAGCPLPENTVVSPLLCGVGFRLLPALISASSSALSPVGVIMLKDLVPGGGRRGGAGKG